MESDPVVEMKAKSILATLANLEKRKRLLRTVRSGRVSPYFSLFVTVALPLAMVLAIIVDGGSTNDAKSDPGSIYLWFSMLLLVGSLIWIQRWTHRRLQALIDLLELDEQGMVTVARQETQAQ